MRPQQAAPAPAPAITFNPTADAYVIETSAGTNYGTAANLRVDGSPIIRSYLRFVVSGVAGGTVQSAILRIYANTANTTGFSAHRVADNTWTESGITYTNSPAVGAVINNSQPFNAAAWVEVDVTPYVTADGTYNLAIDSANTTNTSLASRETTANAPQLVVTVAGSGGATATPTSTTKPASTATSTPKPASTATSTSVPVATATPGSSSVITVNPAADSYVHLDIPQPQLRRIKQLQGGQFARYARLPALCCERSFRPDRPIGHPAHLLPTAPTPPGSPSIPWRTTPGQKAASPMPMHLPWEL